MGTYLSGLVTLSRTTQWWGLNLMFDGQGTRDKCMSIFLTAAPIVAQVSCVLVTLVALLGSLKKSLGRENAAAGTLLIIMIPKSNIIFPCYIYPNPGAWDPLHQA